MSDPQPDEELQREFKALFEDPQPVILEITKFQAWCLMAGIQLAARHPEARGKVPIEEAIALVLELQVILSATPRLAAVAAAGWES